MNRLDRGQAVGLLEVDGVCAAFAAIDVAAKAGNVVIEAVERTRQGCNVCIKIRGDVSSVREAIEAAVETAREVSKVSTYTIIPAPMHDAEKILANSDI